MNIVEAIRDERLFRPLFKDLSTWANWITVLKAIFAIEMSKKELLFYPVHRQRNTSRTASA